MNTLGRNVLDKNVVPLSIAKDQCLLKLQVTSLEDSSNSLLLFFSVLTDQTKLKALVPVQP